MLPLTSVQTDVLDIYILMIIGQFKINSIYYCSVFLLYISDNIRVMQNKVFMWNTACKLSIHKKNNSHNIQIPSL